MHENCTRVQQALTALGISAEIKEFAESTRSAEDAARALGCQVEEIVKSLVFVAGETPFLALVSGDQRADLQKLSAHLAQEVRIPKGKEVKELTEYPIGGIPPVGHRSALKVLIDKGVLQFDLVWAAAGTPQSVFSCNPRILAERLGAEIVEIAGI